MSIAEIKQRYWEQVEAFARGDELSAIASRFGRSAEKLEAWSRIPWNAHNIKLVRQRLENGTT